MNIVIIADGSSEIGYGHLMRTNSFAQEALSKGDKVTYLTRTLQEVESVCSSGVSVVAVENYDEVIKRVDRDKPDVVITDSYDINTKYQKRLSEVVPVLAVISDDTRHTLCCDVVINGNVYAPELDYDWVGDEPEWLLGTDYLLMREEFRELADETPPWRDPPKRALVTFGGSDVNNVTPNAIRSFDGFDLEIDVIIGPGYENKAEIEEAIYETEAGFNLLRTPDDLPQRMFDADFAVSATGSTVYELLITGTPIIGIPQSDNQLPVAEALDNYILSCDIENIRKVLIEFVENAALREKLQKHGTELVDGKGSQRVYCAVDSV